MAVVTVHRSKGLEFPVVICPYLWAGAKEALRHRPPVAGWRGGRLAHCLESRLGSRLEGLAAQPCRTGGGGRASGLCGRHNARSQLLLLWAPCAPQQSVLQRWLFEDDAKTLRDLPLSQRLLQQETGQQRWRPPSVNRHCRSERRRRGSIEAGAFQLLSLDCCAGRGSGVGQGRDQDPEAEGHRRRQ